MAYNFVRLVNNHQALLSKGLSYFVASFSDRPLTGPEVMVFPATIDGKITDWDEVDGGRDYHSLQDFLTENVG
jgi:hypothetical protein